MRGIVSPPQRASNQKSRLGGASRASGAMSCTRSPPQGPSPCCGATNLRCGTCGGGIFSSWTVGLAIRTTYAYTGTGRLSEYNKYIGGAVSTQGLYSYDSVGQRKRSVVSKDGAQTTTDFTYTGLTLHKLSASQSGGETSETWSITYLYDEYGKPYAGVYRSPQDSTTPIVFALVTTDRGDVVELLDASGEPFAAYRYDAWGSPLGAGTDGATGMWWQTTSLITDADLAKAISERQVLRYAGYCYDSESGLYYLSARHYDPATRQFLSKDLSRNDGEQSAYQYCLGNPVGGTDPTGYRVVRDDQKKSPAELAWLHNRVNEELARSKSENRLSTVDKIGNWLNKYCHPRGWGSLAANANDPSSAILYDFVTGAGPRERYYGASNQQAQEMMGTTSMRSVWRRFQLEGAVDEKFAYDTYVAWGETVLGRKDTPSFPYTTAPAQVGGYAGATIDNNGDGTATVTIKNDAGLHSFTNGVLWNWPKETGPYSTIHQTFQWTWPIDYKPEQ
jgi:RHS repeat-associated protein